MNREQEMEKKQELDCLPHEQKKQQGEVYSSNQQQYPNGQDQNKAYHQHPNQSQLKQGQNGQLNSQQNQNGTQLNNNGNHNGVHQGQQSLQYQGQQNLENQQYLKSMVNPQNGVNPNQGNNDSQPQQQKIYEIPLNQQSQVQGHSQYQSGQQSVYANNGNNNMNPAAQNSNNYPIQENQGFMNQQQQANTKSQIVPQNSNLAGYNSANQAQNNTSLPQQNKQEITQTQFQQSQVQMQNQIEDLLTKSQQLPSQFQVQNIGAAQNKGYNFSFTKSGFQNPNQIESQNQGKPIDIQNSQYNNQINGNNFQQNNGNHQSFGQNQNDQNAAIPINISSNPQNLGQAQNFQEFENLTVQRQYGVQQLLGMFSQIQFKSITKQQLAQDCFTLQMKHNTFINEKVVINRLIGKLSLPNYKMNHYLTTSYSEDAYQYGLPSNQNEVVWHVNFADSELFGFCLSHLFAQDEIQCAEHPLFYAVRHAMQREQNQQFIPKTTEFNQATPILLYNFPFQVKFNLAPSQETPQGIYGNNFRNYNYDVIRKKAFIFEQEQPRTNIIAMAALQNGMGAYTMEQIQITFYTAFLAFRQVALFSQRETQNKNVSTVIHTGNWGTGAFGNNAELIAVIQTLAAQIAQIDTLHYHTFNKQGTNAYKRGEQTFRDIKRSISSINSTEDILQQWFTLILQKNYQWGVSDGN